MFNYFCIFQVKAGLFMNLMCILVLTLATNTWGKAYFKFDHYPDWAGKSNATASISGNATAFLYGTGVNATL